MNLIELYRKSHLENLNEILDKEYIQVLALGNTGCGKSTMLVSLLEGPDSLAQIKYKKKVKLGQDKYKDVVMKYIGRKNEDGATGFKIGHDQANSETFLPNFQMMHDKKIMFIDVAGL